MSLELSCLEESAGTHVKGTEEKKMNKSILFLILVPGKIGLSSKAKEKSSACRKILRGHGMYEI